MAKIFDSKKVAERYFKQTKEEFAKLKTSPNLALVCGIQGEAPDIYGNLLKKDANRLGVNIRKVRCSNENELISSIKHLNKDKDIHGIAVLYPLGFSITRTEDIMNTVDPEKDIEGLHAINSGYLVQYKRFLKGSKGQKCVVPATAKAIVKTLQFYDIPIENQFVTIINDSPVVGKPAGLMLKNLGATVVNCYDKTKREDLEAMVSKTDILITAVPGLNFKLTGELIKPGAAVMDISEKGNFNPYDQELEKRASIRTSPLNGIGKTTRAMMFGNLGYCSYNLIE